MLEVFLTSLIPFKTSTIYYFSTLLLYHGYLHYKLHPLDLHFFYILHFLTAKMHLEICCFLFQSHILIFLIIFPELNAILKPSLPGLKIFHHYLLYVSDTVPHFRLLNLQDLINQSCNMIHLY